MIGAPVNYQTHIDETGADEGIVFDQNVIKPISESLCFLKACSSLVGPGQGVTRSFPDRRTDHELELAVVIGREARGIARDQALDYVAGYTMGLDMTVRGGEDRSIRKSVDSYSVLGPWLTTADEVEDPNNLDLVLKLNGEVRQAAGGFRGKVRDGGRPPGARTPRHVHARRQLHLRTDPGGARVGAGGG